MINYLSKYIITPLWLNKNKPNAFRYLQFLEKSQYWKKQDLLDHQFTRLKELLIYANEHTNYYNQLFKKYDFNPYQFKDFSDLQRIPILKKKDIQQYSKDMISKSINKNELIADMTGGSTGAPLHYFYNISRSSLKWASTIRHNRWAGYDLGDKIGVIWGHRGDLKPTTIKSWKAFLRHALIERSYFLDSSSMTEDSMLEFYNLLKREKIRHILAYANSIFLFTRFLEQKNLRDLHLESIITSAEYLSPEIRQYIESFFHTKVYDRYGCREFSIVASECEHGEGKHINAEVLFLEFGEFGKQENNKKKIIVTDLYNFGMPFIRYEIGDVGEKLGYVSCECGRTLPKMEITGGRVTDFIKTPDGVYVSGASLTIYLIAKIPGVAQAQLIQEEINKIIFRIVKSNDFSEKTLHMIREEAVKFLGNKVHIDFEFVDTIEKTPSGKYQFSITKISDELMGGIS